MLTETIKTEELLTLPANDVLWRLYHEEEVTLYDRKMLNSNAPDARTLRAR